MPEGVLALVGGDEFKPGNEEQDRLLVASVKRKAPAYVVPTAAARQGPEEAVAHARSWFGSLGLAVEKLPVLKPADARSRDIADIARAGGFFYLVGGDPGLVAQVLRESLVWEAIVEAWLGGAALAGSSAGAMAMCEHTLIRATWPDRTNRRPSDALGLIPGAAVLPHFETFGHRWIESARRELPGVTLVGIDERSAAVWSEGSWRATGPGAITVIEGEKAERYESGATIAGLANPNRMLRSK